ncbi:N-acetylmuramoyl-L-alanine amidase [Bacillus nitratireducens]|uniref:N-acetylmuramoyl-L-alanine amidase n=2 Tax=Bacillus nitratireducens TaxID=2026193 RepID=UPI0039BFBA0E
MPAILVKLVFINNKEENEKLGSEYWRQRLAEAIYHFSQEDSFLKEREVSTLLGIPHFHF